MESVQRMRWILVAMTAVAAVVALAVGFVVPGVILLLGVAAHTAHWWFRERGPAAAPTGAAAPTPGSSDPGR
jgi:hypothetical protein